MTTIRNLYPRPIVGPEPGLVAAYDFDPADLALGRYLDKSGNGADFTTRAGTPLVGQGGGVHFADAAGASQWRNALLTTGATPSFALVYEYPSVSPANVWTVENGNVLG
jgi:hypothetical protein